MTSMHSLRCSPHPAAHAYGSLRRRIDVSLSRALCDRDYAQLLLADPTIVLDGSGCTPQQFLELRGIHANDIQEFACQAEALFWPTAEPLVSRPRPALVAAL